MYYVKVVIVLFYKYINNKIKIFFYVNVFYYIDFKTFMGIDDIFKVEFYG